MSSNESSWVNDKGQIKVNITPKIRAAAERLVDLGKAEQSQGELTSKQRKKQYKKSGYKDALEAFYRVVYEANPQLDPDRIRDRTQMADIKGATNDALNALIEEIATQKNVDSPKLLNTDVSVERG